MKKSEIFQLLIWWTIVLLWSFYLQYTGTLRINVGKIATDVWVVTSAPVWVSWELIVSPYDAQDDILWYIAGAKYTLDGWFYQVTDTNIIKALDLKAQTGVESKLIIERSTYGGNTKTYTDLVKKLDSDRIQIKPDDQLGVNFNHTKTFIRDDADVLIATANLSYTSFRRNREYRVIVDDTEVVDSVRQMFTADWKWDPILPSSIHESLFVCPINCRSWLRTLLEDVQESVWIQAQYVGDEEVVERLSQLQDSGIDVRVLVWEFQDEEDLQWLNYRIQMKPYNHSKALLIDGKQVLIWSMNYSTNSIERNREISVLLNNPKTLGLFKWQFNDDWEKSD